MSNEQEKQHLQELAAYRFTVENLWARVAELEERLEIDHRHPYDGIAARDATIKAQDERIAELESDLEAVGAGGVQSLRKSAAAPQAVQAAVPATNHSGTPNSSTIIVPYGWKLVPDDATPEWVANLEALPDWREAVGECIKRFLAAAPAHPAEGVPAQKMQPFGWFITKSKLPGDTEFTQDPVRENLARSFGYQTKALYDHPTQQGLDAQDAARYRALVESGNFAPSPFDNGMWGLRASSAPSTKAELDAAVDRVIAAQAKQGEQANGAE